MGSLQLTNHTPPGGGKHLFNEVLLFPECVEREGSIFGAQCAPDVKLKRYFPTEDSRAIIDVSLE